MDFCMSSAWGGIVVRQFIVDRQLDLVKCGKQSAFPRRFAFPWITLCHSLTAAAKALGHAQADALRFSQDNAWLNDLDKNFMNLKESRNLPLYGKELTEDKFCSGESTFPGPGRTALFRHAVFCEAIKIPESDHFSICKLTTTKPFSIGFCVNS